MTFVILLLGGLLLGIAVGTALPISIPVEYAKYLSIALLACLDTVFGGLRARLEASFDDTVFMTGFFSNALMAAGLVFIGDRLGIDLYYAAIIVFGLRIFQNLAMIRRYLLKKF